MKKKKVNKILNIFFFFFNESGIKTFLKLSIYICFKDIR